MKKKKTEKKKKKSGKKKDGRGRPKGSKNKLKTAEKMTQEEKERYNTLWSKKPSKRTSEEKKWMAKFSNPKVKCRKKECSLWIM